MASRLTTPQSLRAIMGGYLDPKPIAYRGVTMRSRLERDFARHLDELGVRWEYEPGVFGTRGRGYLPDFRLIRDDGRHYVEVKPTVRQAEAAKARIEIIWETYPEAVLIVVAAQASRWFAREPGAEWRSWVARWRHA